MINKTKEQKMRFISFFIYLLYPIEIGISRKKEFALLSGILVKKNYLHDSFYKLLLLCYQKNTFFGFSLIPINKNKINTCSRENRK